uniref:Uncharacterized protein n=1 Tax=Arundo donax TaxID=35708 RepID=A0A0A9A4V2_ARUDO
MSNGSVASRLKGKCSQGSNVLNG